MRFRDWLYRLFEFEKRDYAERRVRELIEQRGEVYERLMTELCHIKEEVRHSQEEG